MFIIKLKNIRASTILGIHPWEKESKRLVIVNVTLHVNDAVAGSSDEIKDAVDYCVIEQRIVAHLENASYNLIEKLVNDLAILVLSLDGRIARVTLEIDKPGALRQVDSVSVAVTLDKKS